MQLLLQKTMMTCLLLSVSWTESKEYYLSPDGCDNNPGDIEKPWQTINKANESLRPGDTALFLKGEYQGTIAPLEIGEKNNEIVFRSHKPQEAILKGTPGGIALNLKNKSHVIIEDFLINPNFQGTWATIINCNNITIQKCVMQSSKGLSSIRNSDQIRLIDNYFSKNTQDGDAWTIINTSHLLIEGNVFTRAGHCPLILSLTRNVVIRGNIFNCEWGRNYTIWTSGKVLIEKNIITRARDSAGSADGNAKNLYDDSIFRYNSVYDNLDTPTSSFSYFARDLSPTNLRYRTPFRLVNSRIYNNTFADNTGYAWSLRGENISANEFRNNIFYKNNWPESNEHILISEEICGDNRFISNLFFSGLDQKAFIRYRNKKKNIQEIQSNFQKNKKIVYEFFSNLEGSPEFRDSTRHDYQLIRSSTAIDSGTPLAHAIGNGKSNKLLITDGIAFFDGFGIENELGDWIMIGDNKQLARITKVENRYYQGALLKLDREVAWSDGAPVSLPWAGNRPDIGAFEYASIDPKGFVPIVISKKNEIGEPIKINAEGFGKPIKKVSWRLSNGRTLKKNNLFHIWHKKTDEQVIVRAEFQSGEKTIAPVFLKLKPTNENKFLVTSDFEEKTKDEFWGKDFKFYRPWLAGFENVKHPQKSNKCMRIFFDPKKQNIATALVAPGKWEIKKFPIIKISYCIPKGVSVALIIEPCLGHDNPYNGWVIASVNDSFDSTFKKVNQEHLMDDNNWHDLRIDLRKINEVNNNTKYLRRSMFLLNWKTMNNQEFFFDDFSITSDDK